MRVGVTGSSGLIGAALVTALEERDDDVVRFVRPGSTHGGTNVIRWEPSKGLVDEDDLRRVGGFDAVVNLAGAGIADRRWSTQQKDLIRTSRVQATTLLADVLRASSGTAYLASGSAIGVYGSRTDETLDETSRLGDDFLARVCIEWEAATDSLTDQGSSVSHLRTGIVLTRRGGALRKQLPLFRLGIGGPIGDGHQWLSPISLRDEVRAILWLLETRATGPFNLVAPAALSNRDFAVALARRLHRPAFVRVPRAGVRLAIGPELADATALASQRVVPAALVSSGFRFESPDIESIIDSALA
ncbi:MAG: TIGR01777 family oxidoreductase [Acidimicrobiales bacterium]